MLCFDFVFYVCVLYVHVVREKIKKRLAKIDEIILMYLLQEQWPQGSGSTILLTNKIWRNITNELLNRECQGNTFVWMQQYFDSWSMPMVSQDVIFLSEDAPSNTFVSICSWREYD